MLTSQGSWKTTQSALSLVAPMSRMVPPLRKSTASSLAIMMSMLPMSVPLKPQVNARRAKSNNETNKRLVQTMPVNVSDEETKTKTKTI